MAYTIGMVIVDFFKKMWGFFYLPVLNARLRFFRSGKSKDEANFLTTLKSFISFGGKIVNKESIIKIIRSFPDNPEIASIILNSVSNNNLKASIITELLLTLNTFSDSVIKLFINLGGKLSPGQARKLFDKEIKANDPDWDYIVYLIIHFFPKTLKALTISLNSIIDNNHKVTICTKLLSINDLSGLAIKVLINLGGKVDSAQALQLFDEEIKAKNPDADYITNLLKLIPVEGSGRVLISLCKQKDFNAELIKNYIGQGADLSHYDNSGKTAFHYVCSNNKITIDLIEFFLIKNPFFIKDNLGNIPCEYIKDENIRGLMRPKFYEIWACSLINNGKKVSQGDVPCKNSKIYYFVKLLESLGKIEKVLHYLEPSFLNKVEKTAKFFSKDQMKKGLCFFGSTRKYEEENLIFPISDLVLEIIFNYSIANDNKDFDARKIIDNIEIEKFKAAYNKRCLEDELIQMCCTGDLVKIDSLLKQGVNLNCVGEQEGGRTFLSERVCSLDIETLKLLSERGALLDNKAIDYLLEYVDIALEVVELLSNKSIDLNKKLYDACTRYNPRIDSVNFLLKKGVDPNCIKDKYGNSLLGMVLWLYPNEAVVKVLVENGADPNKESRYGKTSLHYACDSLGQSIINTKIIEFLLERKANPNKKDSLNETPLELARKNKYSKEIIELLEKRSLEIIDLEEKMFLESKKENASAEILSQLLDEGVDINKKDNEGKNILYYLLSQKKSNLAVMIFLLDKKIKISNKDIAENLLIFLCREGADQKYIKICLAYEISADDKALALCWVCFREDASVERVKCLLDDEVDLNWADPSGMTALHCACNTKKPNVEVVRLLLAQGANPNKKGKLNHTPLELAYENKNCSEEIVKLLEKKSLELKLIKKAKESFFSECYKKDAKVEVLQNLLRQGVDINEKYNDEITALQIACENTSTLEVVQFLWENSNVNNKTEEDLCHALGFACQNEDPHLPIIKYFLEKIKEKSEMAGHALAYVCYMKNPRIKIVKYLLENKVDLTTHYYEANVTILHLLFLNNNFNPEIIRLLLQYGANPEPEHPEFESPIYLVREADMPKNKKQEILNLLLDNNNQNKLRF